MYLENVDNLRTVTFTQKRLKSTQDTNEMGSKVPKQLEDKKKQTTKIRKWTFFVRYKLLNLFGFLIKKKNSHGLLNTFNENRQQ